jgi:beta-xylosidase
MTDQPEQQEPDYAADIAELEAKHAQLAWQNVQEVEAIAQFGVMVDPSSINRLRIDTFIAYVFRRMGNVNEDIRKILTWQFEIDFEEKFGEQLKEVKGEARKAVLGMGGQVSPEQMQKMWGNGNGHGEPGPGGLFRG